MFQANQLINSDETGIYTVQNTGNVIAAKGKNRLER